MAHFAKVIDGRVTQVIVAEPEVIESGLFGDPSDWVQTSYNTSANTHKEGGTPLRGNYAAVNYYYDKENDVFYSPAPYASWSLDKTTWQWRPPINYPSDGKLYNWDENTLSWKEWTVKE